MVNLSSDDEFEFDDDEDETFKSQADEDDFVPMDGEMSGGDDSEK